MASDPIEERLREIEDGDMDEFTVAWLIAQVRALRLRVAEVKRERNGEWVDATKTNPPRHRRSVVRHPECGEFEATPCYGLHNPWWVPRTVDVFAPGKVAFPFDGTEWFRTIEALRAHEPAVEHGREEESSAD